MRNWRWYRLATNISLVVVVSTLARLSAFFADPSVSAALIVIVLMALQTLAFAEPGNGCGDVSLPRFRRVLSVRAVGFVMVSLPAAGSYELQRKFMLNDLRLNWNLLWLLAPLGFSFLVDTISCRPHADEYWTLGKATAGRRWRATAIGKADLGSCVIKVFFYPLMFVLIEQYLGLFSQHWRPASWSAPDIYGGLAIYYLLIDLIFGASGYALSLKILGNRVQSVNPYPIGWFVTIICYPPFWDMLGRVVIFRWHLFSFRWHEDWIVWTQGWPVMQFAWLAMIACSFVMYAWSTVELGTRFSNLSYRGTVDTGPYRLMKHPAYVSKVLSSWLITVPFVPLHGWLFALQQCLALSFSCSIYYLRAKYEEKHLLQYPEYKAYAARTILRRARTAYGRRKAETFVGG